MTDYIHVGIANPPQGPISSSLASPPGVLEVRGLTKLEWMAGMVVSASEKFPDATDVIDIVDDAVAILAECAKREQAAVMKEAKGNA
jgi:hypothetical protein